ncbi:TIGR04283 family arsenosugar biosynthesis glycosyltransferase [Gracilimonas sp.]|uniref:TIGR04283 family arsenosugar biosynthesis glycosyltransferase n=1 Tax=Gracilimonas sp. TaxID=1974203 RepID=UPI0028711070|nr:TIGR04283 family arsenosugar biosynthesis glycosyltransferase [Gracilimonas sp.]
MEISIIIPTYNESGSIEELLIYLKKHAGSAVADILVVDGQSSDDTVKRVRNAGYKCIISQEKGRAAQMNLGAKQTSGDILYFVHADSIPPTSFTSDILNAIQNGAESGCYRFKFNSDRWLLKINAWFTRFDRLMCRGGDQTLFIKRDVFEELSGFRNYEIMEDFEMISRLRDRGTFKILADDVIVSARKYEENSYLKMNFINLVIFTMFYFGASKKTMVHAYQQLIAGTKFGRDSTNSSSK